MYYEDDIMEPTEEMVEDQENDTCLRFMSVWILGVVVAVVGAIIWLVVA